MQTQPPPSLPKSRQPFLRVLMPAVMLVAVLGMVAAMVLSGMARNPTTFLFPLMLVGSVLMMFQPGGQDVDETRRSYHRHLDALSDGLRRSRREQVELALARHPHPGALWTFVTGDDERIDGTDREPGVVRIGTAVQAPDDPLDIPVDAPPEDLEPVCAMSLRDLAIRHATVEAPVAVDLREFPVVAVTGKDASGLVRAVQGALVMQDEDTVTVTGPHDRWLPHHGPLSVCFLHGGPPATPVGQNKDTAAGREVGCAVVAHPDRVTEDAARDGGLLLRAEDGVLSAWTVDGWRPFAVADSLSDVELAALCRSRCRHRQERSLLDLPGGELRAPVGTSGGAPVYLDIREAAKGGIGPHGLCIGATGSGKSEFLRSVVTSFAHHHPPSELNFVLVDFKGGAAFSGMERLPHTSAVITNLSEEALLVDRMKDALLGEMHRRQEKLRAAGMTTATDFNGTSPGEMPSLLVVVDEFSELLITRPEFAEVFAAIGRLGRSLGLHLLLASQRLEEGRLRGLESHLSYRVGLRTFSAAESRALIGSPAAYELPASPGEAILADSAGGAGQIRFRSAYVSGPQTPADRGPVRELGAGQESTGTVMELVIDRLAGPNLNPIWLEPLPVDLPASLLLGENRTWGTGTNGTGPDLRPVPVGLEDLPFDGVQKPCEVDLRRRHWAVVGSPGTGKTTVLRTLTVGLVLGNPGVVVYVFDPGGSLAGLARLPQVAAVVGVDLIDRMFDELEQDPPEGVTHRILLVDGVDALGEADRRLSALVAGGLERGVHVVVTALRWTFRPSLRDLLVGQLELRLPPGESNHRDIQRSLPDAPGRGVSWTGHQVQMAWSDAEAVEHARRVSAARGDTVRTMRVLPASVNYRAVVAEASEAVETAEAVERRGAGHGDDRRTDGVLLGLGGADLGPVYWDLRTLPHLTVAGRSGSGATTALRTVVTDLATRNLHRSDQVELLVTDVRRGLLGLPGYRSPVGFVTELEQVTAVLTARIPGDVTELSPESLRNRSWWSGPDYIVVVDDLDHSTELAAALETVVPLLPYAADIGLHLVTARRSAVLGRSTYTPLFQGIRDSTAWILLSAPREDGPVAGQALCPRPPGRGLLVQNTVEELQIAVPGTGDIPGADRSSADRRSEQEPETEGKDEHV